MVQQVTNRTSVHEDAGAMWIIQCLGLEQEQGCVLRLLWMFTFQPGWGLSRPMGGAFRCPSVPHLGCCLFRDAPSCAGTGVGSARSRMHAFPLPPPRPLPVLVLPGTGAGTASDGGSLYSCVAALSLHSGARWQPGTPCTVPFWPFAWQLCEDQV